MAILDERRRRSPSSAWNAPTRRYPSVGALHPPALRLERTIRDLFGLVAHGLPDTRPWLDHGNWGVRFPLGDRIDALRDGTALRFLPVEGEALHQIAVGPVHAGIIEPGHFRFTANGETVVRLEQRLGYVHKGIEGLMAGADLERAAATRRARLRRQHGGLCLCVFAAPSRRRWARGAATARPGCAALMAELERLANHLGDIGAICNDASFALMHAHCARPARARAARGRRRASATG